MKSILMFTMGGCPFCRQALDMVEALKESNPEYRSIPIEKIDETEHPELAEKYDYWYVPTFYVEGEKLMEGVPTLQKVEAVLQKALNA